LLFLRLNRATWYRRTVLCLAHVAAALAVCYMVINVQVFHMLRHFTTYSLFLLAGGLKPEKSVDHAANLQMRLLLALIPLLALAAHLAAYRYLRPMWQRLVAGARALEFPVAALILAFGALAYGAQKGAFSPQRPADFARNPHWHMARSYLARLTFGQVEAPGDIDSAEFEPGHAQPGLDSALLTSGRPRNVVLIVLESTSVPYMQPYGYPDATMPHLAALRNQSIIFDNVYSNATQTVASNLTLFSSLYNDTNKWNTAEAYPKVQFPCAASWIREHGYRTYFLGTGGTGVWKVPDESVRFLRNFDLARTGDRYWSSQSRPWPLTNDDYSDDDVFREAQLCIDEAGRDPFFLMLWNYGTHSPYDDAANNEPFSQDNFPRGVFRDDDTTEEYLSYLRSLHNADRRIGTLYRHLQERGLAEDTLVIVTGDHGEAWGQHGHYFHGFGLNQEDVNVPMIFVCPRLAHLGPHRATVGGHIDLWPTVADVLGFDPHPQWQGHSLFAAIDDDQRRAFFSRVGGFGAGVGMREGRYKYIFDCDDNSEMLFDLQEDPGELNNLAAAEPEDCLRLRRRLSDWILYQPAYLKTLER
jgi:arylsulfatase A-like enzyme